MALSAAQMQEAVINNLPAKTGKSLEEWIRLAQSFSASSNKDIVNKLKTKYGLGHVQAQTIVWRMNGDKPYVETSGYEEALFKTKLALYGKVKNLITSMDTGITVKPCKTYVPFYKNKQFAIVTEKRGDLVLGLNLQADMFPELDDAVRLGGSDRINKMLIITEQNLNKAKQYIKAAIQQN